MSAPRPKGDPRALVLLGSVFVVAAAGLVYELIAGTLSTYLLGSSVTVFSVVIGVFLCAMGLGAFLAKFVTKELARAFILAELVLAAVGGLSPLILFAAYAATASYALVGLLTATAIGALVGLEIPLLLRILEERSPIRIAVSHVLALDYLGALAGSLLFPLLLLPHLGLVRTGALFGVMNLVVAGIGLRVFRDELGGRARGLAAGAAAAALLLVFVLIGGGEATSRIEDSLYSDPVVLAESTPYQRIVVTRWRDDVRLFLDGNLQFSSADEYRYHEALVHPAMASVERAARVLVLGGGDGLAVREVLKHEGVRQVVLVDLDPTITRLFAEHPDLSRLNGGALRDPRVEVVNDDAVRFLQERSERFDVILMDLPDPNDAGLSRLYAEGTFRLARRRLNAGGALVTQATSPFYAPEAFWCIVRTVEAAMAEPAPGREEAPTVRPYRVHVPSFGEWGFAIATDGDRDPATARPEVPLRYLNPAAQAAMFALPADLERREVEVNRLSTAILARYYLRGWKRFN